MGMEMSYEVLVAALMVLATFDRLPKRTLAWAVRRVTH